MKRIDMTGIKYNDLTVLEMLSGGKVRALCDCGKETTPMAASLRNGNTRSCGCRRETNEGRPVKDDIPYPVAQSLRSEPDLTRQQPTGGDRPVPLTTAGTFMLGQGETIGLLANWLNSHGCYTYKTFSGKYIYDYNGREYGSFKSYPHAVLHATLALIDRDVPKA